MRADQLLLQGLADGSLRLYCDRYGHDWTIDLPPHSTLLDVERAMKTHKHVPGRTAA